MRTKIIFLCLTTGLIYSYGNIALADSYTIVLKSSEHHELIAVPQPQYITLECHNGHYHINQATCLSPNNNIPNQGYCSSINFSLSGNTLSYSLKDPTHPGGLKFGISYTCIPREVT